jgi:hypothetical protein
LAAAQFFVGRTLSSTYTSLNRLVWQVISSLAALSRFDVGRQHRVSDQPCAIHTRVHLMVPSYLPVISAEEAYHRCCPLCCQDRHSYDRVSQPTRYTDRTSATTVNALRNCQCRVCQTGVSQHQLSAIELMTLLTTTVHHSQLIILKWIPISN